jgi:hypothetical protein
VLVVTAPVLYSTLYINHIHFLHLHDFLNHIIILSSATLYALRGDIESRGKPTLLEECIETVISAQHELNRENATVYSVVLLRHIKQDVLEFWIAIGINVPPNQLQLFTIRVVDVAESFVQIYISCLALVRLIGNEIV